MHLFRPRSEAALVQLRSAFNAFRSCTCAASERESRSEIPAQSGTKWNSWIVIDSTQITQIWIYPGCYIQNMDMYIFWIWVFWVLSMTSQLFHFVPLWAGISEPDSAPKLHKCSFGTFRNALRSCTSAASERGRKRCNGQKCL